MKITQKLSRIITMKRKESLTLTQMRSVCRKIERDKVKFLTKVFQNHSSSCDAYVSTKSVQFEVRSEGRKEEDTAHHLIQPEIRDVSRSLVSRNFERLHYFLLKTFQWPLMHKFYCLIVQTTIELNTILHDYVLQWISY